MSLDKLIEIDQHIENYQQHIENYQQYIEDYQIGIENLQRGIEDFKGEKQKLLLNKKLEAEYILYKLMGD